MYYFAYGSNMDADRMRDRGISDIIRQPGKIPDYELVFNKISSLPYHGFANIIPRKGSCVEGIVYSLGENDIVKLDKYEDYPSQYDRCLMEVLISELVIIQCMVYISRPEKVKSGLLPAASYMAHLLKGKEFLSDNYYHFLKSVNTL
jgi:gamma-glutamylcyclotransferase (GGCT)/AIG2-like uncharacterized protein YtfP